MIEEEAPALVGFRVGSCETLSEGFEFGSGLRAGDAGIKASDDGKPVILTRVAAGNAGGELLNVAERHPELWIENEVESVEPAGGDTDDGVRPAGKSDGFAEDGLSSRAWLPKRLLSA